MKLKKMLAGFMTLCMMATAVPVTALADEAVAKIGEETYTSLASALEAAEKMKGDVTITLTGDVEWETGAGHGSTPLIGKDSGVESVTIDGQEEYTLTATGAGVGSLRAANGGKLVFKGLYIDDKSESYAEDSWEFTYLEFAGNLEFNRCAILSGISLDTDNGQAEDVNAKFVDCAFESKEESVYCVWIGHGDVTFEGCSFTGTRGAKIHEAYGSEVDSVTFDDCAFRKLTKKPGLAIGDLNGDTVVTIKDCVFDGVEAGDQGKFIYESDTDVSKFDFNLESNAVLVENAVAEIDGFQYVSLQEAIDAAESGDTVKLLEDCDTDITIVQKEDVNIVLDGNNKEFSGTIYIHGQARYDGEETLTIQNVDFVTTEAGRDFISANSTASTERYAHNVTVKDCSFTAELGEDAENEVVGMRFRQAYDIKVEDCIADGLHSLMWATGGEGISVADTKMENCKNGISFGTSTKVAVKDSSIETTGTDGYGLRFDGSVEAENKVENCEIEAFVPILVRNATNEGYMLKITGKETNMEATGDACVVVSTVDVGKEGYPSEPDSKNVEINAGTYNYAPKDKYIADKYEAFDQQDGTWVVDVDTELYVAEMNGEMFLTLQEAINAAEKNPSTVTVLKDHVIDVNSRTYGYPLLLNGHDITLDLNGKEVTFDYENKTGDTVYTSIALYNKAKLKIVDSSAEQTGKIYNKTSIADAPRIIWVTSACSVVIEGGNFVTEQADTMFYTSNSNKEIPTELYIRGGNYEQNVPSEKDGSYDFFNQQDGYQKQIIEVTGGTFNHDFRSAHQNDWEVPNICPAADPTNTHTLFRNTDGTFGVTSSKCTVTFDVNGGSEEFEEQTFTYPSDVTEDGLAKVTKPVDPTRDGYTFKGWYLNGKLYDFNTFVTGDMLLIAEWEKVDDPVIDPTPSTSSSKKSSKKYSVDIEDTEDGTVKASSTRVKKDATVTLTVTPDEGYELDDLVVLDKDGEKVKLKDKGNGKYTFTMPRGGVEVEASFVEKEGEKEPVATEKEFIKLTIGQKIVWIFDEYVVNDVAPEIKNDRTMLPIRIIAEALGAKVTWNEAEQKVTIAEDDLTIEIFIGQPFATVNGKPVQLDAPAYIANDRTYLPLRFVAENLGATVEWNAADSSVTIFK